MFVAVADTIGNAWVGEGASVPRRVVVEVVIRAAMIVPSSGLSIQPYKRLFTMYTNMAYNVTMSILIIMYFLEASQATPFQDSARSHEAPD